MATDRRLSLEETLTRIDEHEDDRVSISDLLILHGRHELLDEEQVVAIHRDESPRRALFSVLGVER